MITERDKEILRWIEKFKSITIDQCSKLFFKGNKMAYDQARKRLRYLNQEGLIKRYRKDPKSETVYYMEKKLREHDLKILDVIVALQQLNTTQILMQNKIEVNKFISYIVDATIVIDYNYPVLIEVDFTHYTSDKKIKDIIEYLEDKHKKQYIFFIIRESIDSIKITDVGVWSKLIWVNWNFNKSDNLTSSLRSLLEL